MLQSTWVTRHVIQASDCSSKHTFGQARNTEGLVETEHTPANRLAVTLCATVGHVVPLVRGKHPPPTEHQDFVRYLGREDQFRSPEPKNQRFGTAEAKLLGRDPKNWFSCQRIQKLTRLTSATRTLLLASLFRWVPSPSPYPS